MGTPAPGPPPRTAPAPSGAWPSRGAAVDSTVACSLMPSVEAMTVDALSGLLSGSPDHAGVARDNQGGRRPAEGEQDPAGCGEPLPWPAGGVEIAAGPGVGLDHGEAEVDSEADLLDCRARRTWAGGGPGVAGDVLSGTAAGVAGPEAKAGAGNEDEQQADQGSPGMVAVADAEPQGFQVASVERQAGPGTPSSAGPGVQKTAPTVVLLGDQNPAGVPLVAGGPVHGRELLPGLRRVARGVASQQNQPLAQGGGVGDALVGRAG